MPSSMAFEQDAAGVTAHAARLATGGEETGRAQYMIAADGAQSRVAPRSASRMAGEKDVYDSVNILFQADLRPWTADRPAALYFIENERLRATFLTINGRRPLGLPGAQPEAARLHAGGLHAGALRPS